MSVTVFAIVIAFSVRVRNVYPAIVMLMLGHVLIFLSIREVKSPGVALFCFSLCFSPSFLLDCDLAC